MCHTSTGAQKPVKLMELFLHYGMKLSKPKELLDKARAIINNMREKYDADGATDLSNICDELTGTIDQTAYLITLS